jgi:hypothetical protein
MERPHIEQFIERFKYGFNKKELEYSFMNGNCYHFAVILKNIYPEGLIVEDVICNHFMLVYEGQSYDILGAHPIVNPEYLFVWGMGDELRNKRVKRDCIYMEGRML